MTRTRRVPGEKPLFWIGSSKADLIEFPEVVKDEVGVALSVAQFGSKHPKAKPWKGEGPGVLESLKITGVILTGPYTPFISRTLFMSSMPFRRNRRKASRRLKRMWS